MHITRVLLVIALSSCHLHITKWSVLVFTPLQFFKAFASFYKYWLDDSVILYVILDSSMCESYFFPYTVGVLWVYSSIITMYTFNIHRRFSWQEIQIKAWTEGHCKYMPFLSDVCMSFPSHSVHLQTTKSLCCIMTWMLS